MVARGVKWCGLGIYVWAMEDDTILLLALSSQQEGEVLFLVRRH